MNGAKNTMSFAVMGEDEVSRLDGLDGNERGIGPSPALPACGIGAPPPPPPACGIGPSPALPACGEGVGARIIVIPPRSRGVRGANSPHPRTLPDTKEIGHQIAFVGRGLNDAF